MENLYDVIIIGAGPAGLSASIYAMRAELKTLVIEKTMMPGGQVLSTYEVDNYPGFPGIDGFSLSDHFRSHAEKLGQEFVTDDIQAIRKDGDNFVLQGLETTYQAKTVIIASGAKHRLLGVPGEKEFTGQGVSYCATCDGAFFRNKTVAVIGGGDVAVEDAIFLARMAKKVYLVHRRDELRAIKALQSELFSLPNVEFRWSNVVEEIKGDQRVSHVVLNDLKNETREELEVDGVFVAVGIIPQSEGFVNLIDNQSGYLKADETCVTSVPGIFAAGDVRTKQLRQISTAIADGANCITSIDRYLSTIH